MQVIIIEVQVVEDPLLTITGIVEVIDISIVSNINNSQVLLLLHLLYQHLLLLHTIQIINSNNVKCEKVEKSRDTK